MERFIEKIGQDVAAFTSILNFMTDFIFLLEAEGDSFRYIFINHSALKVLNIENNILGSRLEDVIPNERCMTLIPKYQQVHSTKKPVDFIEMIETDQGHFIGETVLNPILTEDGECKYVLAIVRDITDREIKEQKLKISQKRLNSLIEHNGDAVFEFDLEGNFISINGRFTEITGYIEEDLIGTRFIPIVAKECLKETISYFERVLTGCKEEYEATIYHKNGQKIQLFVKNVPIIVDRVLVGVYGIATDITEQKKIERLLIEKEQRYKSLFNNHPDGIFTYDVKGNFTSGNAAVEKISGYSMDDLLGKSFVPMMVPEDVEKTLYHFNKAIVEKKTVSYEVALRHKDGHSVDLLVMSIPIVVDGKVTGIYGLTKDITKQKQMEDELRESEERYRKLIELSPDGILVHQEGKIVFVNPTTQKLLHAKEESLIGKPVLDFVHAEDRDKVIKRMKKTQIQKEKAETVEERFIALNGEVINGEATAVPISYMGKPATLVIVRDITERLKREKELQETKKRLELYWNNVHDAVFSIGYDGSILDVNPSYIKMLGFSKEELRNEPVPPIFIEDPNIARENILKAVKSGEDISNLQTVRKTKDGRLLTVLASYKSVNEQNILAIGMFKDISEQVKIQQALEESEERYRSLFDYNRDAVWSLDLEGNFTSANPAFEKILGINYNIVTELNFMDFEDTVITPFQDVINNFEKVVKQGKSVECNISMYSANGDIVHLTVTNVPIYVNGKIIGLYGIGKNVTEEVNAEKVLRESERRYRLITENMNDLIVIYNLDAIVTYASPSYEYVLGVKPEDYVGTPAISLIHEDDRPRIRSQFANAIKNQSPFTIDFRKKNQLGESLYFETVCMPLLNDQKVIEGFVGVSRNITDRKNAEDALRESQERYQLIADNSHDLIRVMNLNQEVTYLSPSYQTVLGFTLEEIKQNDLFNDIHPDDAKTFKEKFKEMISTQKPHKSEFRHRHKEGHWVWLESIGTPIVNEQGSIEQIIMVSRNISDRKYYEEKMKHLAFHDPLTDLPNRRLFEELVEQALKESEREGRKTSIMYLDLDKFKQINDTMGHDVGDELLIEFTKRVKGCLRKMDIMARMGGDEFTILLPKTEKLYVKMIAERILKAVQEPYFILDHTITTTSSIGVAIYPHHGNKAEELIKRADEALYYVKENGRNGFSVAKYISKVEEQVQIDDSTFETLISVE